MKKLVDVLCIEKGNASAFPWQPLRLQQFLIDKKRTGCQMYNIGICDDGRNICASIENMVLLYTKEREIKADTKVWYTGEGLCSYLEQGNHIDILFLDIELFELTGIEVGDFIRNQLENREMQIVYISGKSSYAQKLFKTQPMDFLIKPITQPQIDEALDMAVKIIGQNSGTFEFKNGKEYYYVSYGEIMYFVSEGRKVKIITLHGEWEFYGKMRELEKNLPGEFITIHQSYIINREHVARYTYEMVELTNGTILTISKVNRKKVREKILRGGWKI